MILHCICTYSPSNYIPNSLTIESPTFYCFFPGLISPLLGWGNDISTFKIAISHLYSRSKNDSKASLVKLSPNRSLSPPTHDFRAVEWYPLCDCHLLNPPWPLDGQHATHRQHTSPRWEPTLHVGDAVGPQGMQSTLNCLWKQSLY